MTTSHPYVLLVEDGRAEQTLMQIAWEDAGLRGDLRVLGDGRAALAHVQASLAHDPPALILLDVNLPGLSGLQVLEALKTDPVMRLIPVLVMSGVAPPALVAQAYALQANSYLLKPSTQAERVALLTELMAFWRHPLCRQPSPAMLAAGERQRQASSAV